MASRRTRIKGIANIPQRKKVTDGETNDSSAKNDVKKQIDEKLLSPEKVPDVNGDSSISKIEDNINKKTSDSNLNEVNLSKNEENKSICEPPKQPAILRRKFIKPTVNVINRKAKHIEGKEEKLEETVKYNATEKIVVLNEQIIKPAHTIITRAPSPQKPHVFNVQDIVSNETHFTPNGFHNKPDIIPLDKVIRKLPPPFQNPHHSDSDYPPPPPSPSKINRSRIKAIPRLNNRRTSFSASESEDESRRQYNRIRNDSVCSVASATDISNMSECMSPQRQGKEFNSVIREKCKKKVHSRKLAEARRQFNLKYFGSTPDRQKLTMIDLIFYNPTTNPMKNEVKEKENDGEVIEEIVDDPESVEPKKIDEEDENKSDEENEMPVPQLKVGPQGEIILDEKSLVVENKGTKRNREELQKSKVIDGDFDTGYGVYKRAKRSKDWSQNETLRFYKALNTIGTDFTLMCDLFPKRNRRELKLKFKKEEKVNKALIDKAMMNPCEFDYRELKDEVDMEEKELQMLEEEKVKELKAKKEKCSTVTKKIRVPKVADVVKPKKVKEPKPKKLKTKKSLDISSVLDESDADESNVESDSDADFEVINPPKRTRYGRIPKSQKEQEFDTELEVFRNNIKKPIIPDTNPEPGSLMFVPVSTNKFEIFMVTPNGGKTPLNIEKNNSSEQEVENIMTITAERRTSVPALEYNVTIPAEDNTLKESEERTILEL
ncbi:unnamed protein product [Brassicogethes aeneus]|uniref:Myb-like domain-containing protein n=1 Tax=Brassicogethes aeneus TaxID=1431903 RepID=A0A9P0AYR8_BRAAE|nr:unnamed protein product [Brassicogethes aeneus]